MTEASGLDRNSPIGSDGSGKIENSPKLDQRRSEQTGRTELHEHIKGRGLISNIALGLSDGLVTNIAFLAGFSGAVSISMQVIRFAGLAVMIAGCVSMFFGGLLAGQSQHDLFRADAAREQLEIEKEPDEEKEELLSFYMQKGLTSSEAEMVVQRITADKRRWLEDMLKEELHIHKDDLVNPLKTAVAIGLAFLAGAFVPLIPYLVTDLRFEALTASVVVSLIFLFGAGYWKGQLVGRRKLRSAFQMLAIGAAASAILYLLGTILVFV